MNPKHTSCLNRNTSSSRAGARRSSSSSSSSSSSGGSPASTGRHVVITHTSNTRRRKSVLNKKTKPGSEENLLECLILIKREEADGKCGPIPAPHTVRCRGKLGFLFTAIGGIIIISVIIGGSRSQDPPGFTAELVMVLLDSRHVTQSQCRVLNEVSVRINSS
ncbi:hypothetical protein INR49_017969 [Caranx melampygus]|nr:hypothetical protein INR49_017969 [Caranx melampygus]